MKRGRKPERVPKGCETLERLLGEKKIQRASSFTAKPKPMRKRAKTTGPTQIEFFREIWSERPHFSEVSGEFLGEEMQPICMSHLLPKGSYRKFKFRKDNIVLMTPDEHQLWHSEGPGNLMFSKGWSAICDKYFELKREANGL
jgi:hypothetical protein